MAEIIPAISNITLNLNGLNITIKKQRLFLKIPTICYTKEIHFRFGEKSALKDGKSKKYICTHKM